MLSARCGYGKNSRPDSLQWAIRSEDRPVIINGVPNALLQGRKAEKGILLAEMPIVQHLDGGAVGVAGVENQFDLVLQRTSCDPSDLGDRVAFVLSQVERIRLFIQFKRIDEDAGGIRNVDPFPNRLTGSPNFKS